MRNCQKCGQVNPTADQTDTAACPNCGAISARVEAAIAAAGADVLYILTGQRSAGEALTPALKADEAALLDNYRHSPSEAQDALRRTGAAFARAAGRKAA